jgi:hypothetical protein
MPVVQVEQIDINFPFEPYKCQVDYMTAVINCLINVTEPTRWKIQSQLP